MFYGLKMYGIVLAMLWGTASLFSQELLFDADFSSLDKAETQWENLKPVIEHKDAALHDGGIEIKTAGMTEKAYSLKPKVVLPPTFSVEFKAMVLERSGKDNHFSLNVDGVTVVIRQWGLVCIKGKEASSGQYGGIGNNKEHAFLIESETSVVRIFCNGTLIHKVEKPQPAISKLGISFYNINVLLKDFKVYSGERSRQTITANLLRNSSFETTTNNLPDYWGSAHWGITGKPWAYKMNEFRQHWGIDRTIAYDGRNSFRIEATDDPKDNWNLGLYSCWPSLRKDSEYVFSVYLKSDRDDMPVRIGPRLAKGAKEVKAGKEWRRYEVSFKCQNPSTEQVIVCPVGKGILWIDAAQLEESGTPTPYACHGSEKSAAATVKTPQMQIPRTELAPALDGTLNDPVWKNAARCQMVNAENGKETRDKTDVFIIRDEYNLYLAVECFDSQMEKLVANVKEDKGPVWNDDDVEFFFKPDKEGNSYYQFAINSLGVKYEGKAFADLVWNAEWRHQVKRGKNSWIVTAAIPFSTLAIESGKNSLGFNVCRGNPKTKEISAWSPTGGSFLKFENWGRLLMGSQVGGVFVADLRLEKAEMITGVHDLSARIVNNTAQDINGILEVVIESGKQKISRTQQVELKSGMSTAVRFPGLNLSDRRNCMIILNCRSSGNLLLTKSEELETMPVLVLSREFSYFSNEKDLRFAVNLNGRRNSGALDLHYILRQESKRLHEDAIHVPEGTDRPVITIPNSFGTGNFRLEVELNNTGRESLAKTEENFSVLPHVPCEGKINLWRHSIQLAGKEVFLWSNLLEFWPDEAMVKTMADNGFNNITLMISNSPTPEQLNALMKYGERCNINFMIWFGHPKGLEYAVKAAPYLKNQPAFLGFFALDEVKGKMSNSEIDAVMKKFRQEIGGNTLIFHNENDYGVMQKANFDNADILSVDHYTIPERELASVSLILERLRKLAGNRATCFIAQSTGNAYSYGREPTPEELVNQVYQSFVCDVWNVMFFANIPLGAESFPTMKRLRDEQVQLIRMGVPFAPDAGLSCSAKNIKFICRETATQYIIVAVNQQNNVLSADFSAVWLTPEKKIRSEFDAGLLNCKINSFSDSFPPLGRRVYVIDK